MSEPEPDETILSVNDVNLMIRNIVTNGISDAIKVKGEISNLKVSNGNTYLTLKDNDSSISGIAWKKDLNFKNGDEVVVTGKITFFIKSGTYQITIYSAKNIGIGDLHKQYSKMKKKFESKGWFNKKRQLPSSISRIGIISSLEGAALQDILFVLNQNKFKGDIIIKNCLAQGGECPNSVKSSIKYFNKIHKKTPIDVLLVARGGGSFEDLMGFSSKEVVRSIYKSPIVTISAIGHEVDFMLSDFSADIRAPTPSIAGEMISNVQRIKTQRIYDIFQESAKIGIIINNKIEILSQALQLEKQKYESINLATIIENHSAKLTKIQSHVANNIQQKLYALKVELEKLERDEQNYDYKNVLKRGYTLLVTETSELIKTKADYEKYNKKLKMIFADGELIINNNINK